MCNFILLAAETTSSLALRPPSSRPLPLPYFSLPFTLSLFTPPFTLALFPPPSTLPLSPFLYSLPPCALTSLPSFSHLPSPLGYKPTSLLIPHPCTRSLTPLSSPHDTPPSSAPPPSPPSALPHSMIPGDNSSPRIWEGSQKFLNGWKSGNLR